MKLTRRPSLSLGSLASSLGAQLMRHPLGPPVVRVVLRALVALAVVGSVRCSSASVDPSGITLAVKHFTDDGFPSEDTYTTLDLFSQDRSGRVVNVNEGVFWYSRDAVFSIEFDVDGCPPSGIAPVKSVTVSSTRNSRAKAAEDVWRWLQIAKPPTMPSRSISDEASHTWFQSTWSRDGHTIHVQAWVTSYESEWFGVLHLYPQEVLFVY